LTGPKILLTSFLSHITNIFIYLVSARQVSAAYIQFDWSLVLQDPPLDYKLEKSIICSVASPEKQTCKEVYLLKRRGKCRECVGKYRWPRGDL